MLALLGRGAARLAGLQYPLLPKSRDPLNRASLIHPRFLFKRWEATGLHALRALKLRVHTCLQACAPLKPSFIAKPADDIKHEASTIRFHATTNSTPHKDRSPQSASFQRFRRQKVFLDYFHRRPATQHSVFHANLSARQQRQHKPLQPTCSLSHLAG